MRCVIEGYCRGRAARIPRRRSRARIASGGLPPLRAGGAGSRLHGVVTAALIAVAWWFMPVNAEAKCAPRYYVIAGLVQAESGEPIGRASVAITWTDGFGPHHQSLETDAQGRFRLAFEFPTASGPAGECRASLETATVEASMLGFEAVMQTVHFDALEEWVELRMARAERKAPCPEAGSSSESFQTGD